MKNQTECEIALREAEANEPGLNAAERLHRIYAVWAARGIEIPGYFENGRPVELSKRRKRMDERNEANAPSGLTPGATKLVQGPEISFLDDAPENAVVLSPRLRRLCAEVGGCQSAQV